MPPRAGDLAQDILEKDFGLSNFKDNNREGDVGIMRHVETRQETEIVERTAREMVAQSDNPAVHAFWGQNQGTPTAMGSMTGQSLISYGQGRPCRGGPDGDAAQGRQGRRRAHPQADDEDRGQGGHEVSLKLPQKNLEEWATELIEECRQSSETRRDLIKMYRSYYYTGTSDGSTAVYNRCYPHIERLGAFLYSPTDVRFDIEFDETEDDAIHAMGHAAARRLNRDFHRRNLDLVFASAVNGGLIDGCNILKSVWGHDGLEGWVIRPQFFGVLREDIDDLDRQEAFVHSTYLTPSAFERTVIDHPDYKEIVGRVKQAAMSPKDKSEFEDDYFHQIIVGGTQPVSTTTSAGSRNGRNCRRSDADP